MLMLFNMKPFYLRRFHSYVPVEYWSGIGATGFIIVLLLPGIAITQFGFPFS